MDPFASQNTSKKKVQNQQNSSFANALAEIERPLGDAAQTHQPNQNDLFSQAMARAGGGLHPTNFANFSELDSQQTQFDSAFSQEEDQKRKMEEEKKRLQKEALRKKLHDQINPIDQHDIFSAKEKKVAEDLEATRREIKQLARDISKLHRDLDIAASQVIVTPGDDGSGYISFLQKLRSFIMLLRQKVKSAQAWAQQAQAKKSKQKHRKKPGMEIGGTKSEQTKTVFDMMHHEQSTNYSGN